MNDMNDVPTVSPSRLAWLLLGAAATAVVVVAAVVLTTAGGGDVTVAGSEPGVPMAAEPASPARPALVASDAVPESVPRPAPAVTVVQPAVPDGPDDATDRSARPGTERAYREAFERLADRSPEALTGAAQEVFARTGPDCERVALLIVLWERDEASALDWSAHALRVGTEHGGLATGHETVASFALGRLAGQVKQLPAAGEVLGAFVRDPSPLVVEDLRRRAAAAVAEGGSRAQLVQLAADLSASTDMRLLRGALRALERNVHVESVRPLYAALADRLPPDWLADAGRAPAEEDG